jgi:hypothetical protein
VRVAVAILPLVAAGCVILTSPSRSRPVDVLDFVIGDPASWPRIGSHSQNQIVDRARREVCWVKYANPRTFECWRWDDQFVYHEVDHGIDGNTGESYSLVDGRWMPRYLTDGWTLFVSTHIVWFDARCAFSATRSGPFRYRQRAWIELNRNGGGDIGIRDVLVLEYAPEDPAGGPGAPETFYFARGLGWYEWARGDVRRAFNRFGGPAPPLARDVICHADGLTLVSD